MSCVSDKTSDVAHRVNTRTGQARTERQRTNKTEEQGEERTFGEVSQQLLRSVPFASVSVQHAQRHREQSRRRNAIGIIGMVLLLVLKLSVRMRMWVWIEVRRRVVLVVHLRVRVRLRLRRRVEYRSASARRRRLFHSRARPGARTRVDAGRVRFGAHATRVVSTRLDGRRSRTRPPIPITVTLLLPFPRPTSFIRSCLRLRTNTDSATRPPTRPPRAGPAALMPRPEGSEFVGACEPRIDALVCEAGVEGAEEGSDLEVLFV